MDLRRYQSRLAALVVAVGLAVAPGETALAGPADWPVNYGNSANTNTNPGETRLSPKTVGKLKRLWTRNFGPGIRPTAPLMVGTTLYVGLLDSAYKRNDGVIAYDVRTGRQKWRFQNPAPWSTAIESIAISGGLLYASVQTGFEMHALSTTTGKRVWKANIYPYSFSGGPTISGSRIYIGCSGRLCAIDKTSGKLIWRSADEESGSVFAAPAVHDGRVYLGVGSKLKAYDAATGALLWSNQTVNAAYQSSPVAAAGRVFAADVQGGALRVFDAKTGTLLWQNYGVRTQPAYASRTLFMSNGYTIVGSSPAQSTSKWLYGDAISGRTPMIANGVLYFWSSWSSTNQFSRLVAVDMRTKKKLWSARTQAKVYATTSGPTGTVSPVVANGRLALSYGDVFNKEIPGRLYVYGLQ